MKGTLGVVSSLLDDNNLSNVVGLADDVLDLLSLFVLRFSNKNLLMLFVLNLKLIEAFFDLFKNLGSDGLLNLLGL